MPKIYLILLVLFISSQFILNGCDAGSDSVATSTTAPSLVSPTDRDSLLSLTPVFKWHGSADKLEIGTTNTFSNMVFTTVIPTTDSTYTMPSGTLQNNNTYYWHVGKNSGGTEYWSSFTFSFSTAP